MSDTAKTIPLQVLGSPLAEGPRPVAADKSARSPVKLDRDAPVLGQAGWVRVRIPSGNAVQKLKAQLRENHRVAVCEEASCPNPHECFGHGTATFMILG